MPHLFRPAVLLLICFPALAFAQSSRVSQTATPEAHTEEEEEPAAVLALGGSVGWPFTGGAAAFGSDTSIEFTAIKDWLVVEAGATSLFTHTSTEWDIDCLFKKPWTLSPTVEVMAGLAPEYANTPSRGTYTNTINAEVVGDFLFWSNPHHRFGFYAEPAFGATSVATTPNPSVLPQASSSASLTIPTLPHDHPRASAPCFHGAHPRDLWREQHSNGHKQTALKLLVQRPAAKVADLFDGEPANMTTHN